MRENDAREDVKAEEGKNIERMIRRGLAGSSVDG